MICPECNGTGTVIYYCRETGHKFEDICHTCHGSGIKPQTNADRIRAMSDEELARFAADRNANETYMRLTDDRYPPGETAMKVVQEILYCKYLYWLKQPVKDGEQ